MDVGRAFSFVFEDSDWIRKVGLAALITLIPIIGQLFLVGWMLEIMLRVVRRDPQPLPDLDFGKYLVRGLQATVVNLVYSLPIILVSLVFGVLAAVSSNYSGKEPGPMFWIGFSCFTIFAVIYGLLAALIQPAALGNMVDKGELNAGLRFGEVLALFRAAPLTYVITLVCAILAGLIAGIGTIACVVGVVFTSAYAEAVIGHLYGQAHLEARNRLYNPPLMAEQGLPK